MTKKTMIDVWGKFNATERQHMVDAFHWFELPMSMGQLALTTIATVEDVVGCTSEEQFGGTKLFNRLQALVPDDDKITRPFGQYPFIPHRY